LGPVEGNRGVVRARVRASGKALVGMTDIQFIIARYVIFDVIILVKIVNFLFKR